MERPDTSDLYKFFTTLGILLIVSSFFVFWTILNSYDIFLIKNEELANITLLAKENIIKRQESISFIYRYRFLITSIIFIMGIVELFYGIKKWKRRQIIIDKTQNQEYVNLINEAKKQTDDQIDKKLRYEAIETRGEEPDYKIPVDITNNYKNIEKKVFDIINEKYSNYFIIQNNVIFEDTGYDIIMIPKEKSKSENIFNIEIKYYTKDIRYAYLINGYRGYLLLVNKFNEYLKNIGKKNIEYILLWIYNSNKQFDILNKYKKLLESTENEMNIKVKIIIIEEKNIEKLELL